MSKSTSWIDEQGSKIAANCEWDGALILQVLSVALEDANFHHEAEIIDQMRAAYDNAGDKTLPRFTLTWKPADEDARFIPADVGDYGLFSDIDDDDDDDDDDGGGGDDYTFPDDHPLFGLNDPAKLPEDDPRYIPF